MPPKLLAWGGGGQRGEQFPDAVCFVNGFMDWLKTPKGTNPFRSYQAYQLLIGKENTQTIHNLITDW